jgi:1-aminocyclopropane-1-carboxylate deaminase/D-cysteine desulfhydrase-like pyridoxal-dependent ACC family enzyme
MAALIDQIGKDGFESDETVIFLHTGGLPAVFKFAEQLSNFRQV